MKRGGRARRCAYSLTEGPALAMLAARQALQSTRAPPPPHLVDVPLHQGGCVKHRVPPVHHVVIHLHHHERWVGDHAP